MNAKTIDQNNATSKAAEKKAEPKKTAIEAKVYVVQADGRATGSLRKKNDEITLTDDQAKFLLLGGHIQLKSEKTKEDGNK